MLERLWRYSVESMALVASLYPLAWGITPATILASLGLWLFSRAVIKSWIGTNVPPVMLTFLYILALFGLIGGTQFIIIASVIIAAFMLKEVKLFKGPADRAVITPLRTSFAALLIILAMPLVALYEAVRLMKADKIGGAVTIGAVLIATAILLTGASITGSLKLGMEDYLKISDLSPFTWLGLVGYEELIGRPVPIANAFFTLLHGPSRFAKFESLGPVLAAAVVIFVLAVLNFTTRWLWSIYREHGIIASIIGHVWYNTAISAVASLTAVGILQFVVMAFIGAVSFIIWYTWRHHE